MREYEVAEQSVGDALTIRELVEQSDLELEVVAGRGGVGSSRSPI